ncbi:MAG TPA: hypothetical protein VJX67_11490 [Blastocatellia bacterium]|nr:hypothetical protein [Blastocatellia bacterium]
MDRLYSLTAGGGGPRPGVRRLSLLYGDIIRIARSANLEDVLETLESDVQLFVAETARKRLFIHAGVVGWNGRAVIVPGRSFSGKSTLVSELVRAGATYYSDEYAVLDPKGRVHPFPKPLTLRKNGGDERQTKVPVELLGGSTGSKPLAVGLVVISHYKEDARWRPQPLSAGRGVLEILANAVPARGKPAEALAVLERTVRGASVIKGVRGDAAGVAASILERMDARQD